MRRDACPATHPVLVIRPVEGNVSVGIISAGRIAAIPRAGGKRGVPGAEARIRGGGISRAVFGSRHRLGLKTGNGRYEKEEGRK